jgi:hypothetical protein
VWGEISELGANVAVLAERKPQDGAIQPGSSSVLLEDFSPD